MGCVFCGVGFISDAFTLLVGGICTLLFVDRREWFWWMVIDAGGMGFCIMRLFGLRFEFEFWV